MKYSSFNKYMAEAFGTMVLVLFGCGSAVLAGNQIGYLGISLAFGLSVLVMVYAIGPISGCHINPAVTLGAWLNRRISTKDSIMYVIFQLIGATIGAGVLLLIAKGGLNYHLAVNGLGQNGFGALGSPAHFNMTSALISEIVMTAIFVYVILASTSKSANTKFAGLAIGLTLVIIHLVSIPVTGTSVNPARSFGPAILVGGLALQQLWLFVVAPLTGAVVGSLAFSWCGGEK